MKLKPLKVDINAIKALQEELDKTWGYDPVSHIESLLKIDKKWVTTTKRIKKINNIFK